MSFFNFFNRHKEFDLGRYPMPNLNDISAQGRKDSYSTPEDVDHPLILGNYELKLTHFWNENYIKTQKVLNQLEEQRNNLELSVNPKNIKANLEASSHGYMNFKPSEFEHAYEHAHNEYKKAHQNYEEFRQDHQLRRLPSHYTAFYKTILLLVILFLLELFINEELFAVITGNDEAGKIEAWFLSFTQTGINMITCFLAGRYLFGRIIFFEKARKKLIDTFVFVFHILLIIYMNLFVGMYRALLEAGADEQNILNTALWPFSHMSDFSTPSALVSGIGMVLALAAYLDGYFSDDSYPGYGNVARILKRSKDYGTSIAKKYNRLWDNHVKNYGDEKIKVYNKVIENIEELSHVLNRIQKIKIDYEQLVHNMNKSYHKAVTAYIQGFNSSSAKKSVVKDKDIFDSRQVDATQTFADVLNDTNLMRDSERVKYIKELKDKFIKEFDDEVDSLNKLTKEKTHQLDQIRIKYKFQ